MARVVSILCLCGRQMSEIFPWTSPRRTIFPMNRAALSIWWALRTSPCRGPNPSVDRRVRWMRRAPGWQGALRTSVSCLPVNAALPMNVPRGPCTFPPAAHIVRCCMFYCLSAVVTNFHVSRLLAVSAQYAERGLFNGRASVCPSVPPGRHTPLMLVRCCWQETSTNYCSRGRRMRAVPRCQRT